jgi:hypothetical protein
VAFDHCHYVEQDFLKWIEGERKWKELTALNAIGKSTFLLVLCGIDVWRGWVH